jgi:hypothetical protein
LNEAFVIDKQTRSQLIKEDKKSAEVIKPFLAGKDVKRYQSSKSEKYLIFTRRGIDIKQSPGIENYLQQFKDQLKPKPKNWKGGEWKGRKPGSYEWYEMQDAVDYYDEFENPKIILPDIALRMQATYDIQNNFCVNTAYIIPVADKYLLAILNSSLIQFLYSKTSSSIRGGYLRFIRQYLEVLPIVEKPNKPLHDEIVKLVDTMLELNKQKQQATLPNQIEPLEQRIEHTDKKIDQLVYQLYGLTDEEIKIVESQRIRIIGETNLWL